MTFVIDAMVRWRHRLRTVPADEQFRIRGSDHINLRRRDVMKAYVTTTGSVFGLLVLAHIARVVAEGPHVATDPFFAFMTVVAAALCAWAAYLLRTRSWV
jgi:hypothetical protein